MTDTKILELYEARSESAIAETANRYGSYCFTVAMNVLGNREDSDECVNDTYLKAWNAIPPERPKSLSTYLARITRNLALDKWRAGRSKKRGGGEVTLLLSELEQCVPGIGTVEREADRNLLEEVIDSFLSDISRQDRVYFMQRYWYGCSIRQIADFHGVGQGQVRTNLHRTRIKLKQELERQGIMT